ncbi:DUF4157 domain-containing protein [Pricia sp.]|uniref:eCIS core domain-containing protein n=1 Tax=Pricia sp. TaxID=2268138 RepID=UPI0035945A6F
MKTAEAKISSTTTHLQKKENKPFFAKNNQDGFFSISNDATQSFFSSPVIQTKLTIGQPNDKYEQEADAMADKVVQRLATPEVLTKKENAVQTKPLATMITPLVQTKCAAFDKEEKLQKKEEENLVQKSPLEIHRKSIFESNAEPPDDDSLSFGEGHGETIQRKCAECAEPEKLQEKPIFESDKKRVVQKSPIKIQRQTEEEPLDEENAIQESKEEIQRQTDTETDEVSSDEEEIQRKCTSCSKEDHLQRDPGVSETVDTSNSIETSLRSSKGGGYSIPNAYREQIEQFFGADFSGVRLHTDSSAVQMNKNLNAQAFTHGSDIYFNRGKYDTESQTGQKLLAHELTHVIQQTESKPIINKKAAISIIPNANLIQRGGGDIQQSSLFIFLDAKGNRISQQDFTVINLNALLSPGIYNVTFEPFKEGSNFTFEVGNYKMTLEFVNAPSKEFIDKVKKADKVLYVLYGAPDESGEQAEEKSDDLPNVPGQFGTQQPAEGYTVKLDWIKNLPMPESLQKVLDSAFADLFVDREAIESLVEMTYLLLEIHTHIDEVKSWFANPEKLVGIALGVEESPAITIIDTWVQRPAKKPKKAKRRKSKGIVGLALKIGKYVEKIRRLLRPVFKFRSKVSFLLGNLINLLADLPELEYLFSEITDKQHRKDIAMKLSQSLSTKLHGQFTMLKNSFSLITEKLTKEDMITQEEVARVITDIVTKSIKHPAVIIGRKIPGLQDAVADNIVAHFLPDTLMDLVNSALNEIFSKLLDTAKEEFGSIITNVLNTLEEGTDDFLISNLPSLFLERKDKSENNFYPEIVSNLPDDVRASTGKPLDENQKKSYEPLYSHNFQDVRIHTDSNAEMASGLLNANAFTIGNDIYFSENKFRPGSKEGDRLIAHELTHVVQQKNGVSNTVQRDFAELRDKLIKKFGNKAIELFKGILSPGPDPTRAKKIQTINERIAKIEGRQVISVNNPKLPEAYTYFQTKGQIKGIRRKLKWIRYVPPLTIIKGRIKIGGLTQFFNPHAAARKQLRRALRCNDKQQAHHLIPLELRNDFPIIKTAEENGWNFNGAENGYCMSNKYHSGSHGNYTRDVRRRLTSLTITTLKNKPNAIKIKSELNILTGNLKSELSKRRSRIN